MVVEGIAASNTTEGHRFLSPGRFAVTGFDDYAAKLKRAHVVLDSAEREAAIWQGAQNLAFAAGMDVVEDKGLLAEVAGLVEWPVPLMGRIAEDFLHLPAEVLQTSMKEHQKFFSVKNPKTGRIEGFVTVANTQPADHGATILKGNQKVLTARLSDARFFYENDLRVAKSGMGEWLEGLKSVTFHNKLGSQADRIARIAALAREIAPLVGADAAVAEQAANLAKADLRSSMVGEFPELQGLMGMYYARAAGLPEAVALAARDHYSPLGPSDAVPTDPVSVAVALADKIDTLTGFWAIDEKPTGSKDPFALRRAALGGIRLVRETGLRASLRMLVESAAAHVWFTPVLARVIHYLPAGSSPEAKNWRPICRIHSDGDEAPEMLCDFEMFFDALRSNRVLDSAQLHFQALDAQHQDWDERILDGDNRLSLLVADLLSFFHDRLKVFLKDQGIRHDVIDACLAMPGNDDLTLLVKRAEALAAFLKTEDGPNLLQGYKRANNILLQDQKANPTLSYEYGAEPSLFETDEERALFAALDQAEAAITPAMKAEDFPAAMQAMAQLRAPIDAFFTAVQVNAENQIVRRNRLNLLHRIRAICSGVADLTKIEG